MNEAKIDILYVEDSSSDSDLTQRELRKSAPNMHLLIARSMAEAYQLLNAYEQSFEQWQPGGGTHFDLVLADLRLPDGSGLDLLAYIQEKALPLPVVILTGSGDEEVVVSALKAGAEDYVIKGGNYLMRLPVIIKSALRHYQARAARSARPLRVLYVEYSNHDIELTRQHLAQHAPFIHLETLLAGPETLQHIAKQNFADDFDVLLLDYRVSSNTLEVLKELRQGRGLDLPIVLITGQGNEEVALQALKLGASDYVIKSASYLYQLPGILDNAFHVVQLTREHKALEQSEKHFRLLAEHAVDIVFRLQLSPRRIPEYVSPAIPAIMSYTPEEIYADPNSIFKIIHPDDRPILDAILDLSIPVEQPHILRWFRKDGSIVWTELRCRTIYDETTGRPVALEGIQRDVTERMHTEEQLRLLSAGINAAANGIAVVELGGMVVWVNPAFTVLTGYQADEVVGHTGYFLNNGPGADEFVRQVRESILAKQSWHGERFNLRKDGTPYAEELTITPVINEKGEITHSIVVMQDITLRKKSEEERSRLFEDLFKAYNATIEGWSYALDLRDRDTEGHTQRVTEMALKLARAMGYNEEQLLQMRRGALLHDIGKMAIPDRILHKEGPLNDEEWTIMRKHPSYAVDLISSIDFLRPALDIPHYHHERWDGSGYPDKLKGEQIPLAARIFAVVDVWDALSFNRPYRRAWSQARVLEYIRSQSGSQFDPHVVNVFLGLIDKIR